MAAQPFEAVATLIFVLVILRATQSDARAGFGGLAIGLTLTCIHLVGISVTGVSVNPARSVGPALFADGQAIAQLSLFIVVSMVAGGLAGLSHGTGVTRTGFAHPTGEEKAPRPQGRDRQPGRPIRGPAPFMVAMSCLDGKGHRRPP